MSSRPQQANAFSFQPNFLLGCWLAQWRDLSELLTAFLIPLAFAPHFLSKSAPVVYHVYLMASASGVLYVGVTNNLESRVNDHQQKHIPGFSKTYNTTKLVYFEPFTDIRNAIAREKQLKRWRREKKILLLEKQNPLWLDLSAHFPR